MSVCWTKEQQQVIDLRNRNLLVSAAAGSGKTAVLVERILGLITDPKHPVDIDRLLIVTFTKAAAAEMRERISNAIDKRREAEPDNINLRRQYSLVHNAQICTIDSFCSFVVRNHFGEIDLDPNFRIGDEGELRLLENDTLDELFENNFAEGKESFLSLVDAYSGKRNASAVKEMVMKIYQKASSSPWPVDFIRSLNDNYAFTSEEEVMSSPLLILAAEEVAGKLSNARSIYAELIPQAECGAGLEKLATLLHTEYDMLDSSCLSGDPEQVFQALSSITFDRMPIIRGKGADIQLKDKIKTVRDDLKEQITKLQDKYQGIDRHTLFAQIEHLRPIVKELTDLTLSYSDLLMEKKHKKRILDFNDVEHFALQILVDPKTRECTKTAAEFRHHYEEIMIDEYQDSNEVQEEILCAISRMAEGRNNMFMVGDVKQSIYRFRQARPELFMQKYSTYTRDESPCQKIELHKNFRSRMEVLDFCNDMFYKLMQADLGNITYNSDAALYVGASYPESPDFKAEVLLFDQSALSEEGITDSRAAEDKKKLEAVMVASRIEKLMSEGLVTDKKTGELRSVRYSDIVILFRSLREWGTTFAEVLQARGIPAHVESSTGYFDAIEVQTILNFLRILDNPYQDIPMAAVLRSGLAGFDNEMLAEIKASEPDLSFAEAVLKKMKAELPEENGENISGEDPAVSPIHDFAVKYYYFRSLSRELPIHELIQHIYQETGYRDYVSCLPAGKNRCANLDMLLEKAIAYEATSYKGLFHFVRYIDQLQKYDVDYGEADISGENEDVVHIMTIHKSKGLEFPIVIVSGIFKLFNEMELRSSLVLHPDLGIGIYEQTSTPRVRKNSLYHSQICERITVDNMGEELRVLYVALTRAKEKLILTGLIKDLDKLYENHSGYVKEGQPVPYDVRRKANSFGDWIVTGVLSYPEKYQLQIIEPEELLFDLAEKKAENALGYEDILHQIRVADGPEIDLLKESSSYIYQYASDITKKGKYSVSELKHDSMVDKYDHEEGEMEVPEFLLDEHESYIPDFAQLLMDDEQETTLEQDGQYSLDFLTPSAAVSQPGVNPGALRGTAVHRVMECLDFARIQTLDLSNRKEIRAFVHDQIQTMLKRGQLTDDMVQLVSTTMIERFITSPAALRMSEASCNGLLFKEKPFVMLHDDVLIQGIIDVFWMEKAGDDETEIILLDYKTDKVEKSEELSLRYATQLNLYKEALERIFCIGDRKIRVSASMIYSFHLNKEMVL